MAGSKFRTLVLNINSSTRLRSYSKDRTMASLLVPPVSVRGMTILDRDAFAQTVQVPCFKLGPVKLSDVMPTLKKYILKLKNLKPVQSAKDATIVYLDPKKVRDKSDIEPADSELLSKFVSDVEKTMLTIEYKNWQADEIFRAVLPKSLEIPTSYSIIGHIVHLNLRDSQLPYKSLIGQVLLDNIAHARTVVNKLNTIDTTYRYFSMEILAGDDDTIATVKENGVTYKFDFARVYWNPRLSTEHANLLSMMSKGDVLYDVFAGVGPFAIPAARKGVNVLANDLNPESYKWLRHNAEVNKVKNLRSYNMDGRDFLRTVVKSDIIERRDRGASGCEHIAMNLPALASQFLDVLCDWFDDVNAKRVCSNPPIFHLYCFVKTDAGGEVCDLARTLVEETIDCPLTEQSLKTIHHVRNVSPNKEMMRVSFCLTENMIRGGEEPARKRVKKDEGEDTLRGGDIVGRDGKEQESRQDEKCI